MIIIIFLLIIVVLLILLSMNYYFNNREKFEDNTQEASKQEASKQEASKQEASKQEASKQEASKQEEEEKKKNINETKIHPIVEIAKENTILEKVKKENKDITDITNKLYLVRINLENKIAELNNTIQEKEKDKILLENDIQELDRQKTDSLLVFNVLKHKMDKTAKKDIELNQKENELKKKENELEQVAEIKNNQNFTTILGTLKKISKNIEESSNNNINENFCAITKDMPKPTFKKHDMTYDWCMCTDMNKNSENCINYLNCKNNYEINKNKNELSGNDLDAYFKCVDLYSDFPKYINK